KFTIVIIRAHKNLKGNFINEANRVGVGIFWVNGATAENFSISMNSPLQLSSLQLFPLTHTQLDSRGPSAILSAR
ncbi:4524_t:CDS:1, partial [Acaulospora morrowiae]